jgi:RNase P/RNase MRP subunit POP5
MFGMPLLPRSLAASLRDLGSAKAETRASAIADLVRHARRDDDLRKRALREIEPRLADEHAAVRAAAAVALGDLAAADLLPKLLFAVDDDNAHVRQMAINALGEIGDARAAPRLRRALTDTRPEVRYQSVIALSRVVEDEKEIDQAIVRATRDDDEAVVHIALRVAEERVDDGHTASEALLERARALRESPSSSVALVAAILLAKAGDPAGHDLVLRAVKGERIRGHVPDREDEQAALELAGKLGMKEAVPYLERRAWGLGRWVRNTSAFHARIALARMGHARAVREILAELDSGKRETVDAAVVAAGRAGLNEARERLARLPAAAADPDLVREALARLAPEPTEESKT